MDFFAEVFEGAAGGAIDPGALGFGGGDAGDELGGFEADAASLEGVDDVIEPLAATCEAMELCIELSDFEGRARWKAAPSLCRR